MRFDDRYEHTAPSPLIGLTVEEATEKFPGNPIRVVKTERGWLAVTSDVVAGRINVETNNEIITKIVSIG